MLLDGTCLRLRATHRLLLAGCFLTSLQGCASSEPLTARTVSRQMDLQEKMGDDLARRWEKPTSVRSQAPEILPPVQLGSNPSNSKLADEPGRSMIGTVPGRIPGPNDIPGRAVLVSDPASIIPPPNVVPGTSGTSRSDMPSEPVHMGIRVPPSPGRAVVAPIPNTPARTAAPINLIPNTTPGTPAPVVPAGNNNVAGTPDLSVVSAADVTLPKTRSSLAASADAQVRIVASIGTTPIYESEVREAVYQRLGELISLSDSQRKIKEREMFNEELRKIIERELILDSMQARLSKKQTAILTQLRESATKESDARLREFKKMRGVPDDETFKMVLRAQGLTMSGIRRQIERNFMMQTYLRELIGQKSNNIGLADMRDYYNDHPTEFQAEDLVKWQDLFVHVDRFKTRAEAKQYADYMAARARKGEDFAELASKFSQGDSAARKGAGIGEKPGEIFPNELEPNIMQMKVNDILVVEVEPGFHVVRIAERTYAGKRPFDEKVQAETRRKIQSQMSEKEYKRLVDTLWRQIQPQIYTEN